MSRDTGIRRDVATAAGGTQTLVLEDGGGVRADGLPAVLADPVRLASTGQVGTAPEPVFDDLARLASSVTGCGLTPTGLAGRLCLAGHPPALIRRADGQVQQVGITGHLLGFTDAVNLADARFRLFSGDLLLLYTDGAIEARPAPGSGAPQQPMFDDQALARSLAETRGMDAAATTEYIADALASRYDGWASDDTALLALRIP